MFRKYYLTLFGFLLAIESSFADNHEGGNFVIGTLADTIGSILGQNGLSSLITNEYVVFSLIFIGVLAGTYSMFKIPLSMVFKSHKKEANVIAIMISLISTTGLFFILTNGEPNRPEAAIAIFGGSVGLIVLSIFGILLLVLVDHLLVNAFERERLSRWWVAGMSATGLLVTSVLLVVIDKTVELYTETSMTQWLSKLLLPLEDIFMIILLGALIYSIFRYGIFRAVSFGKRKSQEGQELLKNNPQIKKAKHIIKKIDKNNRKMKEILKDIRDKIGGGS